MAVPYQNNWRSLLRLWDDRLMNAHSENDPLALWCQYIKKIEEEEASSDKLFSVLRHCTLLYTQDERYESDERLVQIWMRYVSCCSDKLVSPREAQNICFMKIKKCNYEKICRTHSNILNPTSCAHFLRCSGCSFRVITAKNCAGWWIPTRPWDEDWCVKNERVSAGPE